MIFNKNAFDILYIYTFGGSKVNYEEILNAWVSKVLTNICSDFENGLLGIGWLINYGIIKKLIAGNADFILEDVDDALYKLTIKEVMKEKIDIPILLHFVSYYQQRIKYPSKAHYYRRFVHFECMKLILDKLNLFLRNDKTECIKSVPIQINILLKYSFLMQTCVDEGILEKAFYRSIEHIIEGIENGLLKNLNETSLFKLFCCVYQYGNPYWQEKIKKFLPERVMNEEGLYWKTLVNNLQKSDKGIPKTLFKKNTAQVKRFLFECITNIHGFEIDYENTID